jgi:hypothetical protein
MALKTKRAGRWPRRPPIPSEPSPHSNEKSPKTGICSNAVADRRSRSCSRSDRAISRTFLSACPPAVVPFPDGSSTCWWPSILSVVSATTSTKFRGWRARQVQWCSCGENASARVDRAEVRDPRPSSRLAAGLSLPVRSARQTLSADTGLPIPDSQYPRAS